MDITQTSLMDFTGGFASTADLLKQGMDNTTPAPTVTTPEQQPIQSQPLLSTEEILKRSQETPTEVTENQQTTEETEGKEGEEKETAPVETEKKGGRPSTKLPEGFDALVKHAEEKGLLVGFEDGKYENIQDFIDLLEANKNSQVEEFKKEATDALFSSLNPTQQALLKYAEMGVQSPQELIPLLTAMDNYDYSVSLDINNPEHHEEIVRNGLAIQGLSPDIIEAEIAELKAVEGKIASRAKVMKPALDKFNEQQLQQIYLQQEQTHKQQVAQMQKHQQEVKKALIEQEVIGGVKYTKEERVNMFVAIAQPDQKTGSLPIYDLIDKLLESKDFETLGEIYQLGTNKKSYRTKIGSAVAADQAEKTQRALRMNNKSTPIQVENDDLGGARKLARPNKRPSLDA